MYTREVDPYSWAGTMSNLGTALFERQTGDRNDNIDGAIDAYRPRWKSARSMSCLGNGPPLSSTSARRCGESTAAIGSPISRPPRRRSRQRCVYATVRRRPDEWAATQSMLAVVRDELAELTGGGAERAVDAYEQALTIYTSDAFPSEARANANNLAGLLLRTIDPARAVQVASEGLRAAEMLYGAAPTEDGREQELDDNARLYRLAVEAALAAGRSDQEAFELGEAGRGRLLAERLALAPLTVPPSISPELIQRETEAFERLRASTGQARRSAEDEIKEARALSGSDRAGRLAPSSLRLLSEQRQAAVAAAAEARRSLEGIWSQIAAQLGGPEYVEQRRGERVSADELQAWLDAQPGRPAIVIFSALRDEPVAFIAISGGSGPRAVRYAVSHAEVNERLARLESEVLAATAPPRQRPGRTSASC